MSKWVGVCVTDRRTDVMGKQSQVLISAVKVFEVLHIQPEHYQLNSALT